MEQPSILPFRVVARLNRCSRYGQANTRTRFLGSNSTSIGSMNGALLLPTMRATMDMWMTCLAGIPLIDCVGAGSGLNTEGVKHKYNVLKQALENYHCNGSTEDIIRYFGGYEMVMAVGGMLRAAELKMIILVDGFIMTNCVLAAFKLYPEMLHYCIFGHCGDEAGHKRVLDYLHGDGDNLTRNSNSL